MGQKKASKENSTMDSTEILFPTNKRDDLNKTQTERETQHWTVDLVQVVLLDMVGDMLFGGNQGVALIPFLLLLYAMCQ